MIEARKNVGITEDEEELWTNRNWRGLAVRWNINCRYFYQK
jgi:hypothetical protein